MLFLMVYLSQEELLGIIDSSGVGAKIRKMIKKHFSWHDEFFIFCICGVKEKLIIFTYF